MDWPICLKTALHIVSDYGYYKPMGNPLATDADVLSKTQATRKGGKFKVSKEPLMQSATTDSGVTTQTHGTQSIQTTGAIVVARSNEDNNETLGATQIGFKQAKGQSEESSRSSEKSAVVDEKFGSLPDSYHHFH